MDASNDSPRQDFVGDFTPRNRRARDRVTVKLDALCEASDGAASPLYCTVGVINLSTHGAACLAARSFGCGTTLRLELTNASRTIWHERHVRVMHERPVGDGNWIVGCEFLTPLDEPQLRELLGSGHNGGTETWARE